MVYPYKARKLEDGIYAYREFVIANVEAGQVWTIQRDTPPVALTPVGSLKEAKVRVDAYWTQRQETLAHIASTKQGDTQGAQIPPS